MLGIAGIGSTNAVWREACGNVVRSTISGTLAGVASTSGRLFGRVCQSAPGFVVSSFLQPASSETCETRGPYLSPGRIQPPGRREDSETYD